MKKIIDYIMDGSIPSDKFEAHKPRMKSVQYCMFGGHLYRRSFSGPLLNCLRSKAELKVMAKMHEDFCENHSDGRFMA